MSGFVPFDKRWPDKPPEHDSVIGRDIPDWVEDIRERFMSKVSKAGPDECWLWLGYKGERGYGEINYRRKKWLAHRLAVHFDGRSPTCRQCVCHSCDNTSCVNPGHLFVGTHLDNQRDKWSKGRGKPRRGESNNLSKLTEEQVRFVRSSSETSKQLARQLGVSYSLIWQIRKNLVWAHVA